MKIEDILTRLCYYDNRNPDHVEVDWEDEKRIKDFNCYCDNCFYGRTKLANYILKLLNYEKT